DAATWPPRDCRAPGLHGFQQAHQHVGACGARAMADLDIDTLEFAVPHELEELRLGVTPIPIATQVGRLTGVPCDDLHCARSFDPGRQHRAARYPSAAVQSRKVADTDAERWCDPSD